MKWALIFFFFFFTAKVQSAEGNQSHQHWFQKELSASAASDEIFNYDHYYKINDGLSANHLNLISFEKVPDQLPKPAQSYNRKIHFGEWIDSPHDNSCMNTRAKVLVRESKSEVSMNPNGCSVKTGEWEDPYSAKTFFSAADIQVDHFVPLKNAYMTGAFEWDRNKRCLYTNYLGNSFHLIPVSGQENQIKGDQTPMGYVPPNRAFVCQYLKHWLQIKVIWELRITPKEAEAVLRHFESESCDPMQFKVPASDVIAQRQYIESQKNLCQIF